MGTGLNWASWLFFPASPSFLCGSSAPPLPGTRCTLRWKANRALCRRSSPPTQSEEKEQLRGEPYMGASEPITLSRACEVIEITSGIRGTLPTGAVVRITQSLGSGYTVATDRGYMYRVDAKDTDALGLSSAAKAQAPT